MEIITNIDDFENAKGKSLIVLRCKYCGELFEKAKMFVLRGLKQQTMDFCSCKCRAFSDRLSISELRGRFLNKGAKLLADLYENPKSILKFECSCGEIDSVNLASSLAMMKIQCKKCSREKMANSQRKPYNIIKEEAIKNGLTLLTSEEEYYKIDKSLTKKNKEVLLECNKRKHRITRGAYLKIKQCQKCFVSDRSGKKSHFYKDGKFKERASERQKLNSPLVVWRKGVFKLMGKKCDICGDEKRINAHHLNGFHWDIKNRFNPENGVPLCSICHYDFHSKYSSKNNTKQQYIEYKNDNTPITLDFTNWV